MYEKISPFDTLTKRERQVAQLLCDGHTNSTAAYFLWLSPRTVEVHRKHMLNKLGVHRVSELKALALEHNFIEVITPIRSTSHQTPTQVRYALPGLKASWLMDNVFDALVGARIDEPVWAPGVYFDDFVGLQLTKPNGERVVMWIDRDAGMNGPGWVRVEPAQNSSVESGEDSSQNDDIITVGAAIYRIVRVTPADNRHITVEWENGRIADIDLGHRLNHRLLKPVTMSDDVFNSVVVQEYGWAIRWPNTNAAIPSSILYAWADGKDKDFDE